LIFHILKINFLGERKRKNCFEVKLNVVTHESETRNCCTRKKSIEIVVMNEKLVILIVFDIELN
jgi:hypothetical protein